MASSMDTRPLPLTKARVAGPEPLAVFVALRGLARAGRRRRHRCGLVAAGAHALFVRRVGLEDVLHDGMADDVALRERDEAHAGDAVEDLDGMDEARRLVRREIDLRHVAGHDHLRALAET